MGKASALAVFLIVAYVFLFIIQLWFDVFSGDIFFKITITFGVLFATLIMVMFVRRHLHEEDKLKKDKFVD